MSSCSDNYYYYTDVRVVSRYHDGVFQAGFPRRVSAHANVWTLSEGEKAGLQGVRLDCGVWQRQGWLKIQVGWRGGGQAGAELDAQTRRGRWMRWAASGIARGRLGRLVVGNQ